MVCSLCHRHICQTETTQSNRTKANIMHLFCSEHRVSNEWSKKNSNTWNYFVVECNIKILHFDATSLMSLAREYNFCIGTELALVKLHPVFGTLHVLSYNVNFISHRKELVDFSFHTHTKKHWLWLFFILDHLVLALVHSFYCYKYICWHAHNHY